MTYMKILKLCVCIVLVSLSFLGGQYSSDRYALKHRIIDAKEKIAVTELLLDEHLISCNKAGYRRFASFHEHNIAKVYRMTKYATGYPYFLSAGFSMEVSKIFDSYRDNFEVLKSEFQNSCGIAL